ncbi:hypothetical protein PTKIN_Ptkin08bG0046000 [Pterospermum kingtungense]
MGRPPCCDKSNVKRGLWTPEEDARILAYVSKHGTGNWTLVPKKAGLNRCGKSCRLRWTNYLRPDLKHESFTSQEEDVIINLHKLIGPRWSLIARHLPGRTDNDVKNYWNTKLRKKLSKMGIDPVTHKPISQVLSDYGNINSSPNTDNLVGSFGKNLTNTSLPKTELSSITNNGLQNNCMVMKPMIEQVQDSSSASDHNISSSFQASQSQITPASPFSWSEFLLSNPVAHESSLQQEEHELPGMSPTRTSTMAQEEISHCKANYGGDDCNFNRVELDGFEAYDYGSSTMNQVNIIHTDASSSSASTSFIDTILDRDSEIISQFPLLFDGSFDY